MFRPISTAAICSLLAGCVPSGLSPAIPKCPQLATYTPAQAKAVGVLLRGLPKGDPTAKALVDYRNLRRQCGAN